MGTGYTRQSTYIDGDVIKADDTNLEFNHLLTVFALASGHTHDGSAEEGGYVPLISDSTATDKVEIVTGGAKTTGTHQVTGLVTADVGVTATTGDLTATAGNIDATAGSVSAGTTVTSGTGITATTGGVTASAGDITATTGNVAATAGSVSAGTTVTSGTTMTAGTGLTVSSGNLAVSAGNITVSGTVDGRDVATDGTKLDGIEANAKDDQIASEVVYNNSSSGISATDVQAAIDEVEDRVDTAETNISTNDGRLFLSDVVDIAFGASPFSVTSTHDGNLIQCDTTGGSMVVTLPDSASLSGDFRVTIAKMPVDANTVTVNRSGTDTINGSTSSVITTAFEAQNFVLDKSTGEWHAFGGAATSINATSTIVTASGNLTADDAQEAFDDVFAGGLNLPSRNAVMNQDPVSQGTATRTGMSSTIYTGDGGTQAVATGVDGATGDLGALVWIKNRDQGDQHVVFDTVRGDGNRLSPSDTTIEVSTPGLAAITSTGVTVGNSGFVNTNTEDYVAWSFQTNQKTTGTTNHNKAYTSHYNADMGFQIDVFEGDGTDGHEVPNFLGSLDDRDWVRIAKNRDVASQWTTTGSVIGDSTSGDYLQLNTTVAVTNDADSTVIGTDTSFVLGSSVRINSNTDSMVNYTFASVPGVSKVGRYIGTGASGNVVDLGFKAGFILVKGLTAVGSWELVDVSRGDGILLADTGGIESISDSYDFTDTGFVIKDSGSVRNTLNNEYLYLAFADSGSGPTTYSYPTSDDVLTIEENSLISFAEGFNKHGQVDTQELVSSGVTHTLGAGFEDQHLWLYKDKGGSYATTEFRPLEGVTRDDADKWGTASASDTTLRTTAKHFDFVAETGIVLASADDGNEGWGAFSQDGISYWSITATSGTLQYKQTEKRILKSARIRSYINTTRAPSDYTYEGSNDGFNWTTLGTVVGQAHAGDRIWQPLVDMSGNTTPYLYHRLNITTNNGSASTEVAEVELNTILPSDYYLVEEGQMYDSTDSVIDRVYLAEIRTGGTGDVIFLRNLPVAKTKGTDAEYQGDLKVHGEIENRAVATAWVNFDGTQTPPLIMDSYNVEDVVDLATGNFRVVFSTPLDSTAYCAMSASDDGQPTGTTASDAAVSEKTKIDLTVYFYDTAGTAYRDPTGGSVVVFGGKEIL